MSDTALISHAFHFVFTVLGLALLGYSMYRLLGLIPSIKKKRDEKIAQEHADRQNFYRKLEEFELQREAKRRIDLENKMNELKNKKCTID